MYFMEKYKYSERFDNQYAEMHSFLKINADCGYNEHFHWGRLDWMMTHSWLDVEMLPKIALFRDESGRIVGAVIFDTDFKDRWYLLHSISDENLLRQMVEYIIKIDGAETKVKANLNDLVLCRMLENTGFEKKYSESVLEIALSCDLSYRLPDGFSLNTPDLVIDDWQWRLVIHRGFENDGVPKEPDGEVAKAQKHLESPEYIKVFAIKDEEYAAHCGVWYDSGDTAYIEPVVTVPEHRGKGLGRAVVYEAVNRAKMRGAKRAIVLSDQEFYLHIGMTKSSEIGVYSAFSNI